MHEDYPLPRYVEKIDTALAAKKKDKPNRHNNRWCVIRGVPYYHQQGNRIKCSKCYGKGKNRTTVVYCNNCGKKRVYNSKTPWKLWLHKINCNKCEEKLKVITKSKQALKKEGRN